MTVAVTVWRDDADERRSIMKAREVKRGDDGLVTGFGPVEDLDAANGFLEGPMVEIMPEDRPPAEVRRRARKIADEMFSDGGPVGRA